MQKSLKKKTLEGVLWSVVESLGSQGIRFIISIILARLLVPEMFGLIAMLMIFITIGDIFVDSGFGTALVQRQDTTEQDISSVFFLNIIVGIAAFTLFFLTAPFIANFYQQPILSPMARALSLIFIINAFGMIPSNMLLKKVDFKSIAKINTSTNLVSGFIGIMMAITGFGVWSLVAHQLSSSIIRNILYWHFSDWRPVRIFHLARIRRMMRFSLSILATGALNRTTESVYYAVIGKLFSANDLGLFVRAQQLQGFPSSMLATLVGRVTFPVLSKLQSEQEKFTVSIRKILIIISFLTCPLMIGIAAVAEPLILFLLTKKWAGAIPYLQMLCFAGLLFPLEWLRQQAIQAAGYPERSLKVVVVKNIILFATLLIMAYWGIIGIIAGMIAASLISFILNMYYLAKLTKYSVKQQLLDILPYLIAAFTMGCLVIVCGHALKTLTPATILFAQSLTGFFFYMGSICLLRQPAFLIIKNEIWPFIKVKFIRHHD